MLRFEPFIGTWNTTGDIRETEAAPAGKLIATDTYRWLPGRHFVVHDVDARMGSVPSRSMEVMGYDTRRRRFFARSFDDQGASEEFVVTLLRRRWSIVGAGIRFRGGFDPGYQRLAGRWEIKERRGGWRPWIDLELRRA
jgi:hypothetical protein